MEWVNECRSKCKEIKYIDSMFNWLEKPSRSDWLAASSTLMNRNKEIIPGLYLKGEYQPLKKSRGEIYRISLMCYVSDNEMRRVFMLESYPRYMQSHRDENGSIFGPHMHLGDSRQGQQIVKKIFVDQDLKPFSYWAKKFIRHARAIYPDGRELDPPLLTADMFY